MGQPYDVTACGRQNHSLQTCCAAQSKGIAKVARTVVLLKNTSGAVEGQVSPFSVSKVFISLSAALANGIHCGSDRDYIMQKSLKSAYNQGLINVPLGVLHNPHKTLFRKTIVFNAIT